MASAQIFQHTGSNDPATEGWTQVNTDPGGVAGPIDDGGTPAWFVDDNLASFAPGSNLHYSFVPTDAQNVAAASLGWKLSTTLRVVDLDDAPDFSVYTEYAGNAPGAFVRYLLGFGADEFGGALVAVNLGTPLAIGSGGYHTYDLIYDPAAASADLFVDGVERLSNIANFGQPGTLNRVLWGSNSSATTGRGNYNAVSFSIVPEPASLALWGPCALLALARRRRRPA